MCVCVRLAFGDLQAAFYWLVFFLLKETYYTHFRLHMSQLCMIHSLKSHPISGHQPLSETEGLKVGGASLLTARVLCPG